MCFIVQRIKLLRSLNRKQQAVIFYSIIFLLRFVAERTEWKRRRTPPREQFVIASSSVRVRLLRAVNGRAIARRAAFYLMLFTPLRHRRVDIHKPFAILVAGGCTECQNRAATTSAHSLRSALYKMHRHEIKWLLNKE